MTTPSPVVVNPRTVQPWPVHSRASPCGAWTATEVTAGNGLPAAGHGVGCLVTVRPPLLVTRTDEPSTTAATPAWAAMPPAPELLASAVIGVHGPPPSARRDSVHPVSPSGPWRAVTASTWRPVISSDSIAPPG